MFDTLCDHQAQIHYAGAALIMLLEFWIGRSQKVQSNSIIELALTGLAKTAKFIFRRR